MNSRNVAARSRTLRVETLESRKLLSVSPLSIGLCPIDTVVEVSKPQQISYVNQVVPQLEIEPSAVDQLVAAGNFRAFGRTGLVDGMAILRAEGSAPLDNAGSLAVFGDVNGRPEDGAEEYLGSSKVTNGSVVVVNFDHPLIVRGDRGWFGTDGVDVEIYAKMVDGLDVGQQFGIDVEEVLASNVWGQKVPWHQVSITGAAPTMHELVEEATLTADQGTLFVRQDETQTYPQQLLGGKLGESVINVEMINLDEIVDVTYVGIDIAGDSAGINHFELYQVGESAPFACLTRNFAQVGDAFGVSMENQELLVDGQSEILVRPCMKTDMEYNYDGSSSFVASLGEVEARGFVSNNNLLQNDGDGVIYEGEIIIGLGNGEIGPNQPITGHENDVVMAKIVEIVNASIDADGSAVPSQISDIGSFQFTAANHENFKNGANDAVLDGVVFTVNATNVELDAGGFALYNQDDSSVSVSPSGLYFSDGNELMPSGKLTVMFDNLALSSVDTEINRGDSATFVLQGNVVNTNSSTTGGGSILQVSFQRFNRWGSVFGVTDSHIKWLDEDGGGSIRSDWIEYPDSVVMSTIYGDTWMEPIPEVNIVGEGTTVDLAFADETLFGDEALLPKSFPPFNPFTWSGQEEREAVDSVFADLNLMV